MEAVQKSERKYDVVYRTIQIRPLSGQTRKNKKYNNKVNIFKAKQIKQEEKHYTDI